MSTISYHDFTPNKPLKWYNSERREVQGGYIKIVEGGDFEYHMENANVNTFHLNGTNTSVDNQKTTTLFTWANGCHTDITYYITEQQYSGYTRYTLTGTIKLLSNNDYELRSEPFTLHSDTRAGSTLDDYILYSSPGNPTYTPDEIYNISGFFTFMYSPIGPYYAQNPGGHTYSENEMFDRFEMAGLQNVASDESFDANYKLLVEGGDDTPITPILPSDDTSNPGGGDQANPDYNPFSDPINFPELPTGGSSIATGFIRVYSPSIGQLNSLAGVLWGDSFVETIKKIQNDPMEAIISLHSVPFGIIGSNAECRIGNFNTGISMPAVSTQFYTINLGSIAIPEHWASALDYSPYVSIDLYVPFCGVVSVQVDDIIGRTVSVKMNVDIIGGEALISVLCGNSVLYTYNTNVLLRHPISQSSFGPLYQSVLGMLGSTASGFASGGVGGAVGGAIGGALNVAVSKQHAVSRGGSIGGATGVLGTFTPYLIIHRPIQSLASGFAHFKGYPSNITATLGSVSGYTEVESVHLNGITCTDNEKAEIEALLYNGVIL